LMQATKRENANRRSARKAPDGIAPVFCRVVDL
jgi:hypothetical protein